MSLADYKPATESVVLGEASFEVRGLSLVDLSILIRSHLPDLDALFSLFDQARVQPTEDITAVALSIVSQAPGFAANLIALAADMPEAAPQAMQIPAPKQIEIIIAIINLTFAEVGGIKKGMGLIAGLLPEMTEAKKVLTATGKKAQR